MANNTNGMDHDHLNITECVPRTDLAIEAHQMAIEVAEDATALEDVQMDEAEEDGVTISHIHIPGKESAERIGKKPGRYLTLEAKQLRNHDSAFLQKMTRVLARELEAFIAKEVPTKESHCLIVGLGNWNVTPDALGPMVVQQTLVTSHLFAHAPEDVQDGFRPVSAVSPGVLGITGIETQEIIQGIVSRTNPDLIIAVDALAARSIERVNATIQVSNTGIAPGSGVGNKRQALDKETLGIPVIAIGVPTVVDAVSIVSDTFDFVLAHLGKEMHDQAQGSNARRALAPGGASFSIGEANTFEPEYIPEAKERQALMGIVGGLEEREKRQLIREVLQPLGNQLMVTPKEVDGFMEDTANVLANGLNAALHEPVNMDNISAYTR